ncbi:hypothetical protein [Streptomyces sp. ADI97-07]|uniref:hypothetical protein n=1 Tax=Streptomyces sp. ADI97-07 TaxID=1522762 RepID=UPI0013DDC3E9|nr:hypothetical protein [Streptomyces sp. ADI97-07]
MGSMRNPVGPLPSSIYWRRRAVAAMVIALLAALIAWVVTSGGGEAKKDDDGKPGDSAPAPSITPGPSSSGPDVGQPPGGRDESGATGGGDGTSGGAGGTGTGGEPGSGGSGTGGSTSSGTGSAGSAGSAGTTGAAPGGGTAAERVPAGSSLPNCAASALQLSLRTEISYGPDDKPVFRLVARNTSSADCKADFGPKSAVLSITEAGGDDDEQLWSSKDCPRTGAFFLRVPAGATVVHTVKWDRRQSAPTCATPPAGKATPGTYLLEAKVPGEPVQRASFVLAKD